MRVALGRARPREKLIRINAALVDQHPSLLDEVLCHEAAHIAVHELHRGYRRPHGPEWRRLMELAGFAPRARMPLATPLAAAAQRHLWHHQCPVCQAWRLARRPVHRWRCAACINAGLPGDLIITKQPPRGSG